MRAAFVIRFHYPQNDVGFEWRFSYFRSMVLPRILAQDIQDFEIAIWCNPWHHNQFLMLSERIRVFGVRPEADGYVRPEDRERARKFHIDFTYWRDVVGLEDYDLQIGLDSDDLISKNYLSRIVSEVRLAKSDSLHICFQPLMFNLSNLTQYETSLSYGPEAGSPFFAIYQKGREAFKFAYEYSHLTLGKHFNKSVCIDSGYCWFTIHDFNASTRLPPGSRPLLNP